MNSDCFWCMASDRDVKFVVFVMFSQYFSVKSPLKGVPLCVHFVILRNPTSPSTAHSWANLAMSPIVHIKCKSSPAQGDNFIFPKTYKDGIFSKTDEE